MNEKIEFFNTNIDKKRNLIYKVAIGILVVIFFSGIAALSVLSENRNSGWVFQENISTPLNNENIEINDNKSSEFLDGDNFSVQKFPVYIVGEIENPGIYHLENPIYLFELVELAGGLTGEAAKEHINMVYSIKESRSIRIPSKSEIDESEKMDFTDGIFLESNNPGGENFGSDTKVNINTASKSLLETLPGIGPSTADAIVSHRDKFGKFKSIEEIMNVTGIKDNKFNLIKDKITVTK